MGVGFFEIVVVGVGLMTLLLPKFSLKETCKALVNGVRMILQGEE
jgi:hypothetical protein